MSSVCVNWTKSDRPADEVYAGNHDWLSKQLANVVSEIRDKEYKIAQIITLDRNFEVELQKKMQEVLSKHTRQLFNQNNYTVLHDELVEEFNEFAQDIKFELAVLYDTVENELSYQLKNIEQSINLLEYDEKLSDQYSEIIHKYAELEQPSSIDIKLNIITKTETLIDEYNNELLVMKEIRKQKRIEEQNLAISQDISNNLSKLSLKKHIAITKPSITKQEKISKQLDYYLNKIKSYDFSRYETLKTQYENSANYERLKIVFNLVKLEYDTLKKMHLWTIVYKEELNSFLRKIGSITTFNVELVRKIHKLISQKYILKSEFKEVQREFQLYIKTSNTRNDLSIKLQKNLEHLGYKVFASAHGNNEIFHQQLNKGEIVYLDTDNDAYKIMVKLNKDMGFSIRFIKIVASQHEIDNITSYQRQKDQEKAKKWCSNYDKLCLLLKQQNITVHDKLREEPENTVCSYMINENLAVKKLETAKTVQYSRKINE